jgi:hypothetical protein
MWRRVMTLIQAVTARIDMSLLAVAAVSQPWPSLISPCIADRKPRPHPPTRLATDASIGRVERSECRWNAWWSLG